MTATVRGFCAQVYEYVKSDMESDTLDEDGYSSSALEHNAEIASARLGLQDDPQLRSDSMRMMEKTGVLPVLLFKRQGALDLDSDGDVTKDELEQVLAGDGAGILDRIAAEYALTHFDEIRDGLDPFDWYENLERGEILANADEAREEPPMEPDAVFYGPVTEAPPIGEKVSERNRTQCAEDGDANG
ncbi:MAG: hypothetical protein K2Y39_25845 [Candidatus Obscuribacterales bacterium]|nr:hypothetical protein [Candidatus Obscuribacterales bacterium]